MSAPLEKKVQQSVKIGIKWPKNCLLQARLASKLIQQLVQRSERIETESEFLRFGSYVLKSKSSSKGSIRITQLNRNARITQEIGKIIIGSVAQLKSV